MLRIASTRAWENITDSGLDRTKVEAVRQVTVKLPSLDRIRLDSVTRNRVTGKIECIECKSSVTARVKPKQAKGFREIEQHGATVVGKGKPGFPGGTKIPPTRVEIRRPRK